MKEEKVEILGFERDNDNYLYYVNKKGVWAIPKDPDGTQRDERKKIVVEMDIKIDPNFIYFLDQDGDISRLQSDKKEKKDRGECVQYIVVRKDLVETMGYGKLAAQVSHGSLGVLLEKRYEKSGLGQETIEKVGIIEDPDVQKWCRGRFTKLVVYVKTKTQLLNLAEKLDEERIRYKLIYDACFTVLSPEEENGTTLTCMGVIPINRNNVPKFLQKLRLLD